MAIGKRQTAKGLWLVVVLSSSGSKFDIRKGASGRWHRVVVAACLASGWWHRGVCIGKKMGWGLGLFFVVFIFKCVIFILLCLNF